MVYQPQPKAELSPAAAADAAAAGDNFHGTNATAELGGGNTIPPDSGALPDLTRLAIGDRGVGGPGVRPHAASVGGAPLAGSGVHFAVYSQGGPVTINVNPQPQVAPPSATRARLQPGQEAAVQTRAPSARIRLPAGTVPAPEHAADHAPEPAAPLSPILGGLADVPPPSPSLESVPTSATASPATATQALDDIAAYEHIAPRDPTHNRWYVVTAGRRVGIWRDWLHMSDYVNRVPGNAHKLFSTRAEAEMHYYNHKNAGRVEVILP
ncbi:hypothetical protein K466DRAFT_605719 [Polyporus arcularius HHB13444]|uniref:Ribonuclease H1 N-terminal domain-containing protein n=1 Tax=Polyporus arcularius HHB13444 TaxID=1314778 RepID=A0A5C3NRU7_9APHY|nr:hypothetical protein K466DRAFT_605719 [Polyporus arcularius HHB13444]